MIRGPCILCGEGHGEEVYNLLGEMANDVQVLINGEWVLLYAELVLQYDKLVLQCDVQEEGHVCNKLVYDIQVPKHGELEHDELLKA